MSIFGGAAHHSMTLAHQQLMLHHALMMAKARGNPPQGYIRFDLDTSMRISDKDIERFVVEVRDVIENTPVERVLIPGPVFDSSAWTGR